MENQESEKLDINALAGGAVKEAIEYALEDIFQNIKDLNTKAEKARKLTLTIEFKPDESRQVIKTSVNTKTSLVPVNSISTQLLLDKVGNKSVATEWLKQNPHQRGFEDLEKENKKIISIAKEAN